jgi:hypothetical protein
MLFSSGNNGVPDGWWIAQGMSPFSDPTADPDGDLRSNYQEFLDGTDPTTADADPTPEATAPLSPTALSIQEAEHPVLTWSQQGTISGTIIERTADGASWQTVGVVFGHASSFRDTSALAEQVYFYRVTAFL